MEYLEITVKNGVLSCQSPEALLVMKRLQMRMSAFSIPIFKKMSIFSMSTEEKISTRS